MAKSRRRKKGLEHLAQHREMRRASKAGEYLDTMKEMMEISKMYTKREVGEVDTSTFEVTEVNADGTVITAVPDTVLEGEIVNN